MHEGGAFENFPQKSTKERKQVNLMFDVIILVHMTSCYTMLTSLLVCSLSSCYTMLTSILVCSLLPSLHSLLSSEVQIESSSQTSLCLFFSQCSLQAAQYIVFRLFATYSTVTEPVNSRDSSGSLFR